MRVLVAPDKFKGTLRAVEVATALAAGVRAAGADAVEVPVADGGEGTAATLLACRGGRWETSTTMDPLGRMVDGRFALLGRGATAVVEVAEASGLWRVAEEERDPIAASTAGTGVLVCAATEAGADTIIVAAGGSATTDGGQGAVEVLSEVGKLPDLVIACDTLVSFEQAAVVYGPQKGADAATINWLSERLHRQALAMPRDPRGISLTGAAGGLAGGLWAWFGAELVQGAALVLDELRINGHLADVDLVLTGEGRIDNQTCTGKAVGELASRCASAGVPCVAIVGVDGLGSDPPPPGIIGVVEAGTPTALTTAAREICLSRRGAKRSTSPVRSRLRGPGPAFG